MSLQSSFDFSGSTLRQLERDLNHAIKMRRLYRLRSWDRAIARLNLAIMERRVGYVARPVKGSHLYERTHTATQ